MGELNLISGQRKIGIIGGTVFLETDLFRNAEHAVIDTDFGLTQVYCRGDVFFLQRHLDGTPPHRINHHANIAAMESLGVTGILSVCSVGVLDPGIPLGALVVPDDYMQLSGIPTYFNDCIRHITPDLANPLRDCLIRSAGQMLVDGGVYFTTSGPRLETRAEIRFVSRFAQLVGMTFGFEATLAQEKNLDIAGLCSADNLAHGIENSSVSQSEIQSAATGNIDNIEKVIHSLLTELKCQF